MTVIRIREQQGPEPGRAALSFDDQGEYPIAVTDPFAEVEEKRLEWYFEEHLTFPFTDQVMAREAAQSVFRYGEQLFEQVFRRNPDAYARYKQAVGQGPDRIVIEVRGSADFHRLHWESLKDPQLGEPLAVHAPIVRKNLVPQPFPAQPRESPTINLLVVVARPGGKQDVGYRTISGPLVETLRRADLPVNVDIVRPGTYEALVRHLLEARDDPARGTGYYHLIHFDLHGSLSTFDELQQGFPGGGVLYQRYGRGPLEEYEGQRAFLWFVGSGEVSHDPVEAGELAELLKAHQIPIAILNACQSGKQVGSTETSLGSQLMQAGMQLVLAMAYSVTVSAAEVLMQRLYAHLVKDGNLATAIRGGRHELYNQKQRRAYFAQTIDLEDWLLPVVYQNSEVPLAVRPMTPEESRAFHERQAGRYRASQPTYGFHGRDVDVLEVEQRLLGGGPNLLLIRGMGGAGKTTFLQHLAEWWQTTGFIDQVFYFGYDDKAWTRQQILNAIAKDLLAKREYEDYFQPLDREAQQAFLGKRLRAGRHLLILDNLESITGSALAIKNTLKPKEQEHLCAFLKELRDGKTLVLLGSRGGEEWLAPGTFEDNTYDLPGLDAEAASRLASRILERNGASRWEGDADFGRLLQLLDGYPLALEVVLANLARQGPAEVLAALEAGNVALDTGDRQDKTASILRCVEYSHSNLSEECRDLLACLAPFTSVVRVGWLPQYSELLKQHPALAGLPFDRWPEVLAEAENWGLVRRHPEVPDYLQLQPLLPYFLRSRLDDPAQAERRAAVEAAFRELYDGVAGVLGQLAESKEAGEKRFAPVLLGLEYENLTTALNLALRSRASIQNPYVALSTYLEGTQDHERGLELGERILKGLESYPDEQLQGRLGLELAAVIDGIAGQQLSMKRHAEAKRAYERALDLLLQNLSTDEPTRRQLSASIHHQLGMVAEGQRRWEQAKRHYRRALKIQIEFGDRYSQAGTYHNLGMVAEEQRQWEQAERHSRRALKIKVEFGDRYSQASTYHQLGRVAQGQRQWEQAKRHYRRALKIYVEFDDRYSQAGTYHQLGMVAQEQRQWEQAKRHYRQVLEIYTEFGDRYSQATTYHELGMVAQEQRQWEQAKRHYRRALKIQIEFGDRYSQARTYHQLGTVAQEQSQWEQAKRHYRQAQQIFVEFNDRYSQAGTYHNLGVVAEEQRQWPQAKSAYLQSLEIYAEVEDSHHGAIVLGSLARLWEASGDASLPAEVAKILGIEAEQAEQLLRDHLLEATPDGSS
jgi:tetratricopeptide (TPR) repeat protein